MKLYIYDHGWKSVEIRNNDLWMRQLSEEEKSQLLDTIALDPKIHMRKTNIIRIGH